MRFLSLGLVRGIGAQLAGTALGMLLVVVVRALMGLEAWAAEPALVVGAMLGTITFLIGVGSMKDWFKWAAGEETPMHHGPPKDKPAWTRYFDVDYNHRVIGVQYTVTAILLLIFGGGLAMVF
ncbi:MAG: cytochrome c oxidase subunit I, partial [Anaerolineae bacterium]